MRQTISFCLCLAALLATGSAGAQGARLKPVHLATEFRTNPVGIATSTPMFEWTLEASTPRARHLQQAAYRLRLATSREQLQRTSGLLWDSGRVESSTYWERLYGGPKLQSHTTYFWQVQSWTADGLAGPWSEVSQFTTALLSDTDWSAHWIAAEPDRIAHSAASEHSGEALSVPPPPLPVFRHEFNLAKPVASALLFVAGLGQYEVHLNGRDVTSTVLNSGWTDYRKTVLYDTYDVAHLLRRGDNAFGVLLGNGMYNVEGITPNLRAASASQNACCRWRCATPTGRQSACFPTARGKPTRGLLSTPPYTAERHLMLERFPRAGIAQVFRQQRGSMRSKLTGPAGD
jgi:alpha-L-rhamnosidase